MAQVEIRVNGRDYRVTCDDGQEDRLMQLAAFYNDAVSELAADLGQIGDARLMLLAALSVCDELFELRERYSDLDSATDELDPGTAGAAGKAVEAATARIKEIADALEEA